MNALLVDDHTFVRETLSLKLSLEDPSIKVRSCETISEARAMISDGPPDLVFLDVDIDNDREAGLQFLDELKDSDFAGRVVMLSSQIDSATVGRAIGAGAVGFISKADKDPNAMTKAISILLQGGVYISEDARRRPGVRPPPDEELLQPATVKEVGAQTLKISAPRVYEALWHISNGATYKMAARQMGGIAESTVQEFARSGYNSVNAKSKSDFLVMLSRNGWKLKPPQ